MQMYKKDWEREEWAEGWLTSGETPMKGHCLWCEKDLASGKSELLKHAISQKHMKKMQAYCSTLPDQHPFQTAKPGGDGQDQTLAVREPLDPDVSANQEAALVKAENQNYSPRKRTNNNDVDVVEDFDQPANENQPEKKKRRRTKKKMFEYQEVARKPMADDYEYYQLVTYDIHGNQKGQMIAKRRLDGVKKNGLGIYTAVNYFGIQDTHNVHPDFGERQHFGNLSMKPVMATLTPSIRSAGGGGRVGHVICDIELMDGTLDLTSPRAVCQNQIAKLAELQPEIRIKSASEVEFDVRLDDEYGGKDFGHTANWCSINILEENQSLILELLDELKEVKVAVDSFQTEAGPGQFEATIDVTEGIKGPDSTLRFKNATKTFFRKRGLFATYMTKPDPEKVASGMHFNHSLWTKTGRSVFQDGDNPHCLSIYGQQWLAGLITHGPALAALCCPTVNCYRRIGKPWAPTFSKWGEQDRTATFRLKVEDKGQNVRGEPPAVISQ